MIIRKSCLKSSKFNLPCAGGGADLFDRKSVPPKAPEPPPPPPPPEPKNSGTVCLASFKIRAKSDAISESYEQIETIAKSIRNCLRQRQKYQWDALPAQDRRMMLPFQHFRHGRFDQCGGRSRQCSLEYRNSQHATHRGCLWGKLKEKNAI